MLTRQPLAVAGALTHHNDPTVDHWQAGQLLGKSTQPPKPVEPAQTVETFRIPNKSLVSVAMMAAVACGGIR